MAELHSVTTPELKCLFAMVNRIKCTPIADIVDYFKNVHKMLGLIVMCTRLGRTCSKLLWPNLLVGSANLINCRCVTW
jgi:hypothetical protein